jgi:hypothetical protein
MAEERVLGDDLHALTSALALSGGLRDLAAKWARWRLSQVPPLLGPEASGAEQVDAFLPVGVNLQVGGKPIGDLLAKLARFTAKGTGTASTYKPKAREVADLLGLTLEEAYDPTKVRAATRRLVAQTHPDVSKSAEAPPIGVAVDLIERYLAGAGKPSRAESLERIGVRFGHVTQGRYPAKQGRGARLVIPDPEAQLRQLYERYGPTGLPQEGLRAVTADERHLQVAVRTLLKELERVGGGAPADIEDWAKMVAVAPKERYLAEVNRKFRELYDRRMSHARERLRLLNAQRRRLAAPQQPPRTPPPEELP